MNIFKKLRDMGDSAPRLYIIATGAGMGLQNMVWSVPGISSFFVGAASPYGTEDTVRTLGFTPSGFVKIETAVDLAITAYMRAYKPGRKAVGFGLTASVASTTTHRGAHRIIAAIFGDDGCWTVEFEIPKGEGDEQRKIDGAVADNFGVAFIEWYFSERNGVTAKEATDLARARILAHPYFQADGTRGTLEDIDPKKTVFFPGAYNPLHRGHTESAEACMCKLQIGTQGLADRKLVYSTTVNPVHKASLTPAEMLQRAVMMRGKDFVLTENDPLYVDKARKFPGAWFVMGADSMDRMLDPKWGQPVKRMVVEMAQLGCHFLVPGRLVPMPDGSQEYMTCDMVREKHEKDLGGMYDHFHEVNFRLDISSTELRAKAASST